MVEATDIDGDGDFDVLASDYSTDEIIWYRNDNGVFADVQVFADVVGVADIDAGDIDLDGDIDLVAVSHNSDVVTWLRNDGDQGFERVHVPTPQAWYESGFSRNSGNGYARVFAIESRSNDVPMIAVSDHSNLYGLHLAPGGLQFRFTGDTETTAVESDGDYRNTSVAQGQFWYARPGGRFWTILVPQVDLLHDDASFADVNGDGQDELIYVRRANHEIGWVSLQASHSITHLIENGVPFVTTIKAHDVDNDGDNEIVADLPVDGRLKAFKFDGTAFERPQTIFELAPSLPLSNVEYEVLDFDGDRFVDIIAPNNTDHNADPYFYFSDVLAADLDRDGSDEFLAFASDSSADYSLVIKNGSNDFQTIRAGNYSEVSSLSVSDLDLDGDLDILASLNRFDEQTGLDSNIVWFENSGVATFDTMHFITSEPSGARSVGAADVDGDGDLDVYLSSLYDGALLWYRNRGNQDFSVEPVVISTKASLVRQLIAADMDVDGDLDFVAKSSGNHAVYWYENRGDGIFQARHRIVNGVRGPFGIAVDDIDQDGDDDLFLANQLDGTIEWYRNDINTGRTKGDFTKDGSVDADDVDYLCNAVAGAARLPIGDLDRDGIATVQDLDYLLRGKLRVPIGDVNLDAVFDSTDLVTVFRAGEYDDAIKDNSTWSEGDWNCDGDFNSSDFITVFRRGTIAGAGAIQKTPDAHVSAALQSDRTLVTDRESHVSAALNASNARLTTPRKRSFIS